MPFDLGDAVLRFFADTRQTDRAFANMKRRGKETQEAVGKQGDRLKARMAGVGAAIKGAALAFGAFKAIQAVKQAIGIMGDFEQQMNRVKALTGATAAEFDKLKAKAMELGASTIFTSSQVADAMGFMAQAGLTTDQILGATTDTLNLAAAAQLDMASAADIVTNVMSGFGIEADEVGFAVDVLTKSFTSANTDLSQLGSAMKLAGPVAKSFGLTFEETAASLALMGNAGFQGTLAGTALRGAMVQLSQKAKKFGLDVFDATGKIRPMVEIMDQINERGLKGPAIMELFGQRAGPAMAALLGQGSDALREMTSELENSGGTAERIAKVQMQGLNGALKLLQSAVEGMIIKLGELGVLDAITGMVESLIATVPFLGRILAGVSLTVTLLVVGIQILALGIETIILKTIEWRKAILDWLGVANDLDQEIETLKFSMEAFKKSIEENAVVAADLADATFGAAEAIKKEGEVVQATAAELAALAEETDNVRRVNIDWEEQMDKNITKSRAYKLAMVQLKEELERFADFNRDELIPSYVLLAEHNEIGRQALLGMGVAALDLNSVLIKMPEAMEPAIDRMGQLGDIAKRSFGALEGAAQQAITAAILSGESIPKAMKKAAAGAIAAFAAEAIVAALMQTAFGFAALARLDFKAAGEHFTSAALFGAVGGAAAIAGGAIAPRGTSVSTVTNPDGSPGGIITSSGPGGSNTNTTIRGFLSPATLGQQLPGGSFAPGGGATGAGGDSDLIPGGAGVTQFIIQGDVISADTVAELANLLSRAVRENDLPLTASESITVVEKT